MREVGRYHKKGKVVEGSAAAARGEKKWTNQERSDHWMGADFGFEPLSSFLSFLKYNPNFDVRQAAEKLLEQEEYGDKVFSNITGVLNIFSKDEFFLFQPASFDIGEEYKNEMVKRRHQIVRDFFITALKDPAVRSWLVDNAEATEEELDQEKAIDDLVDFAKNEALPDIIALLGAKAWKEHRQEREVGIVEVFSEWKEFFLGRLADMVKSGELLCDETEARRRVQTMGFVIKDSILSSVMGASGQADITYNAIVLSPEILTVSREKQFLFYPTNPYTCCLVGHLFVHKIHCHPHRI